MVDGTELVTGAEAGTEAFDTWVAEAELLLGIVADNPVGRVIPAILIVLLDEWASKERDGVDDAVVVASELSPE